MIHKFLRMGLEINKNEIEYLASTEKEHLENGCYGTEQVTEGDPAETNHSIMPVMFRQTG